MSEHGDREQQQVERRRPDDIDSLFPGRFLKAADIGDQDAMVKITDVYGEDLEGEKGVKPKAILAFERLTPPAPGTSSAREIVLAKINSVALKAMFGSARADWIGKRVVLFGTNKYMPMPMGPQKNRPCIRIYGSPDIQKDFDVTFTPPRRKAVVMTMHATGPAMNGVTKPPSAGGGVRGGGRPGAPPPDVTTLEAEYWRVLNAAKTLADLDAWQKITVGGWEQLPPASQAAINARYGEMESEMMVAASKEARR